MSSIIQIIMIAFCFFVFFVKGQNPYVEECYFLNSTTMNITLSAGPYMSGVDCNFEYGGFELNGVELPLYPQTQSWIAQASYGGMGSASCDVDDTDVFCAGPPSVTVSCNSINDYTIKVDVTAAGNVYNCSILSGSTEQPIVFSSDSNTATNVVTTSNIQNGTLQCTYLSQNFTCYTPSSSTQAIFIPSILLLFGLSFVYLII